MVQVQPPRSLLVKQKPRQVASEAGFLRVAKPIESEREAEKELFYLYGSAGQVLNELVPIEAAAGESYQWIESNWSRRPRQVWREAEFAARPASAQLQPAAACAWPLVSQRVASSVGRRHQVGSGETSLML